jgi:L-fuculokinase
MRPELIAVLDVGKTHARLLLVESVSGEIVWERRRACASVSTRSFLELDVAGTESWLIDSLASAPQRAQIRHFVPIAHGAAAVLIDEQGQRLVAPDYEEPLLEAATEAYGGLRDAFSDTYSPSLPAGLNLARQWFFLQTSHRALWDRARWALLYPQYWAWVLSGIRASEITSLGCHSDLWRPLQARPSEIASRQGWDLLLPPLRAAGEVLGLISPAAAKATGLSSQCRIYCGIHDSNASYLCHLAEQGRPDRGEMPADKAFSVISSGTWTVILAQSAPLGRLREPLDMLANIDAYGDPVATARFMGGREYAQIAGRGGLESTPRREDLNHLLANEVLPLPSFAPQGGPFAGQKGSLLHAEHLETGAHRAALATLYCALMSDLLLENLGAAGPVIIDGPLALNPLFGQILQTLRSGAQVYANDTPHGAATAARFLVTASVPVFAPDSCAPLLQESAALIRSRQDWRSRLTDLNSLDPARHLAAVSSHA